MMIEELLRSLESAEHDRYCQGSNWYQCDHCSIVYLLRYPDAHLGYLEDFRHRKWVIPFVELLRTLTVMPLK